VIDSPDPGRRGADGWRRKGETGVFTIAEPRKPFRYRYRHRDLTRLSRAQARRGHARRMEKRVDGTSVGMTLIILPRASNLFPTPNRRKSPTRDRDWCGGHFVPGSSPAKGRHGERAGDHHRGRARPREAVGTAVASSTTPIGLGPNIRHHRHQLEACRGGCTRHAGSARIGPRPRKRLYDKAGRRIGLTPQQGRPKAREKRNRGSFHCTSETTKALSSAACVRLNAKAENAVRSRGGRAGPIRSPAVRNDFP